MIVNINPIKEDFNETLRVKLFSKNCNNYVGIIIWRISQRNSVSKDQNTNKNVII